MKTKKPVKDVKITKSMMIDIPSREELQLAINKANAMLDKIDSALKLYGKPKRING